MWPRRARCICALACMLFGGCDRLFAINHIPDPGVPDAPDMSLCPARGVSAGRSHTCSIDFRGGVWCWGDNDGGQVQPGGSGRILSPIQIALPMPATQISAGRRTSCARLEDASVWCWGVNDSGQNGLGPDATQKGPIKIEGIGPSAEVHVGGRNVCSRNSDDGSIWCWGGNSDWQSGTTTKLACPQGPCTLPVMVAGTVGSKALAVGHKHVCFIDPTDHVQCWGRNNGGQLAQPASTTPVLAPMTVSGVSDVVAIDASGQDSCAVERNGVLVCWGNNDDGQLGNGNLDSSSTPVSVNVAGAQSVGITAFSGCSVLADRSVSCWGSLAIGDGTNGTYPMPRPTTLKNATKVEGHYYHTCGIENGAVMCWGDNAEGQLGRGSRSIVKTPADVPLAVAPSPNQHAIAVGTSHACVLTSAGLYCWGSNGNGQAGDTSLVDQLSPHLVPTTIPTITGIAAGGNKTCAWGGGTAQCWGRAYDGQLGNGGGGRNIPPTQLSATGVQQVAIGSAHLCLVATNTGISSITCYGSNGNGQLGDGTKTDSLAGVTPQVPDAALVAAGVRHTCAMTNAGSVYCWGANDLGQIGDGGNVEKLSPYLLSGLGIVRDLGAGGYHTCALNDLGDVYCWGQNNNGQIGDGTHDTIRTPKKVITGLAAKIFIGPWGSCALLKSGAVTCWGNNDGGQFGLGTEFDPLAPATGTGFANATSIGVGDAGTCAVHGGKVSCSGSFELLGNGDNTWLLPAPAMLPAGCQ